MLTVSLMRAGAHTSFLQAGDCDTADPVWLGISMAAKDLVVRPPLVLATYSLHSPPAAPTALGQTALCCT